jgi:tRNA G26 N,N-dimethylase Trm1
MTEYNRETGQLTLSLADAQNFHRTADHKFGENPPIEFYVEKLKNVGYEVTNIKEDQLDVNAPEDEIFELLSGLQVYL